MFAGMEYKGKLIGQDYNLAVELIHAAAKDLGGTGGFQYTDVEPEASIDE